MIEGTSLYRRNKIDVVVVRHSPMTEHVEILVDGERVAIVDTLGILQPGDSSPTAYIELRVLPGSHEILEDEGATSFLFEVT